LKKNKYTVFHAWMLLICFIAGQSMMYIHQHKILSGNGISSTITKNQPRPATTVVEKCYMCDALHNSAMAISQHVYVNTIVATGHIFRVGDYDFVSIALILSSGRAPPVMPQSC